MKQLLVLFSFLGLSINSFAADIRLLDIDFAAPIVLNRTNSEAFLRLGAIVYDRNAAGFYGLDSAGNWVLLGASPSATKSEVIVTSGNAHVR